MFTEWIKAESILLSDGIVKYMYMGLGFNDAVFAIVIVLPDFFVATAYNCKTSAHPMVSSFSVL